jgi:hypothetical protein
MNKLNYLVLATLLVTACPCLTDAQKVAGRWFGIGFVDVGQATNNYLCELNIQQNGGVITGEFNYYFRNGFFSNPIKGTFNADDRYLLIQFVPVMYNRTVNTLIGVDCPMHGEFTLRIARTETTLNGHFMSDDLHKFTCGPLKITFKKEADDEPSLKDRVSKTSKEDSLDADTAMPITAATQPPPPVIENPMVKIEPEALRQARMRVNDIARILEVSDDSVRIDLYDNGELDYDTISVFFNKKLVKYKQMLDTRKPIEFYLHVDSLEANNELLMFAENLGLIPPNSAIMIVTDKQHRYEVSLNSDYQKNAAVRLRRIYKPEVRKQ